MSDEQFIEKYEELLNKGYCDCNEMNCLDNDVPTKILNIVKGTKLEAKQLLEENQELKKQLGYLHSGEYLNQLRFERNMLQDVVSKMEVSKEDKMFIDMTRRNTELLEENQELKEQLEVGKEQYNDLVEEKENLQEQLSNSHQINAQQNEFIEYLNKYIKERRRLSKLHKEYSLSEERLSAQCHVLENALLKYKEIIGVKDE